MPEVSLDGSVEDAAAKLHANRFDGLVLLRKFMDSADRSDPIVFTFVIGELLAVGFEQRQLATILNVSRTSISRWAKRTKLPPAAMYRESIISTFAKHVDKVLLTLQPPEPEPGGAALPLVGVEDMPMPLRAHNLNQPPEMDTGEAEQAPVKRVAGGN